MTVVNTNVTDRVGCEVISQRNPKDKTGNYLPLSL